MLTVLPALMWIAIAKEVLDWLTTNCPLRNDLSYGNSTWSSRFYNVADDKATEAYYVNIGSALARAGYNGPTNDDNFYYETVTRWKVNPDFPWDNTNSFSFKALAICSSCVLSSSLQPVNKTIDNKNSETIYFICI